MSSQKIKRPPLGVLNQYLYQTLLVERISRNGGMSEQELISEKKKRKNALKGAITRYLKVDKEVLLDWLIEYNEL